MKLSMVLPGFRPQGFMPAYESIQKSFSGEFELIIVGPYEPPGTMQSLPNVRFIQDWGCPTRCMQHGIAECKYEYFCWVCDDGKYLPGQLDKVMNLAMPDKVIPMMYTESIIGTEPNIVMVNPEYYKMWFHDMLRLPHIPPDSPILGFAIFPIEILHGIGGLNCQYESLGMAFADLSARMSLCKVRHNLFEEVVAHFDHIPGPTGDHGPVHYSQIDHDEPLLKEVYSSYKYLSQVSIPLDNWKKAPAVWARRFKGGNYV